MFQTKEKNRWKIVSGKVRMQHFGLAEKAMVLKFKSCSLSDMPFRLPIVIVVKTDSGCAFMLKLKHLWYWTRTSKQVYFEMTIHTYDFTFYLPSKSFKFHNDSCLLKVLLVDVQMCFTMGGWQDIGRINNETCMYTQTKCSF